MSNVTSKLLFSGGQILQQPFQVPQAQTNVVSVSRSSTLPISTLTILL